MISPDKYLRIVLTIIAVCLVKIAFFSPPHDAYAQFPFMESSKGTMDVNIAAIDNNELYILKNGDMHLGGKKGPKLFENGALLVRMVKE